MSNGPVKLKIKLKSRPSDAQSLAETSGQKRKLEASAQDPEPDKGFGVTDRPELHKPKKLKVVKREADSAAAAPSSNKVKLHIKGPWSKPTSSSGNTEAPSKHSHSDSQAPQKGLAQQRTLSAAASRPPAKQVPNGVKHQQSVSIKPLSKKKKQQHSLAATDLKSAPDAVPGGAANNIKYEASNLDIKTEHRTADSVSSLPEATLGHSVKPGDVSASASSLQPTQAVLVRIINKMQRKDNFNIFRDPVTELMVCLACRSAFLCCINGRLQQSPGCSA